MKKFYISNLVVFISFFILSTASISAQISTIIGRPTYLGDGYTASAAGLLQPFSMVTASNGDVYIACIGDNRIRKVTAATNIITTIAGTGKAGFSGDNGVATQAMLNLKGGAPGLALDGKGNLYISDYFNNRIRKIVLSTNIITTIAGTGTAGYSGDGGAATAAKMNGPAGLVIDAAGNIFFADNNNFAVREIVAATGKIVAFAGNGNEGYTGDGGQATAATLDFLEGVVFDKAGNLYISDGGNNVVRKVDATTKIITTIAGSGARGFSGDGGPATAAKFRTPRNICVDSSNNIYVTDFYNYRVRKIDATTKIITTIAGTGAPTHTDDEGTPATSANINPTGLASDKAGNVYLCDLASNTIRKITAATQAITTILGDGTNGGFSGAPDAYKAQIVPQAIVIGPDNNFYIADGPYCDVRAVNIANSSYIFAGKPSPDPTAVNKGYSGNGGLATNALFNAPYGVAVDAANNIYIADVFNNVVRKVDYGTKNVNNYAGTAAAGYSGDGGAATAALLKTPYGLAIDATGNLYIADAGNNVIRKVDAVTKKISTVAGTGTAGSTGDGGAAIAATLNFPYGVAVDVLGNILILDKNNNRVRKVTAATQKISTIFNNGHVLTGIAVDKLGNIFVSDSTSNTVIRIDRTKFTYQAVAGNGAKGFSGDGGAALQAKLNNPRGLYIDALDQVYIADAGNGVIRKVIMGPLPVDFVNFTATKVNNTTLLQWATATETNNSRYFIERSGDGNKWGEVANISGNGTTTQLHSYTYTDAAPLNGTNYYRIKQVDADGKSTTSVVRTVVFNSTLATRVYPNPAVSYVVLEVNSASETTGDIAVYGINGAKVKALRQHLTRGLNQVTIPALGGLANGVYIIKVTTPNGEYTSKFIKAGN